MQLAAVLVIVGLASAYVARSTWRAVVGKKGGCGSGCGKCSPAAPDQAGRVSLPQI